MDAHLNSELSEKKNFVDFGSGTGVILLLSTCRYALVLYRCHETTIGAMVLSTKTSIKREFVFLLQFHCEF